MAGMGPAEDRLRKLALLACMIQTLVTSTIPAVEYYYVYRLANLVIGPQAWTTWAIAVATGLLGVTAHGIANAFLTGVHLVVTALLSAGLGAYATAWWFVLQLQCSLWQGSFAGCAAAGAAGSCPCAVTSTCSAAELGAAGCAACEAPPAEMCAAVHQNYNIYLLAFTGLTALLAAVPALLLDVQLLMAGAARRGASAARRQAVRVGVDQQTRLVMAGDKPTVTPGTLTDWCASLAGSGDAALAAAAERCRAALRSRGFELPARGVAARKPGGDAGGEGGARSSLGGESTSSGAGSGAGDVFDAAERGDAKPGRKIRRQQVTPEHTPADSGMLGAS